MNVPRSVFLILFFFGLSLVWLGCNSQQAPLTTNNTTNKTYPLLDFSNSPLSVTVDPNLPVGGFNSGKVNGPQGCFSCPVAFYTFPANIISYQPATIAGTVCPPTTSSSSPCVVQPTGGQTDVEASGLASDPLCVHVTGWLNDPESPLFIPGPGNYDSGYLRVWPNFAGGGGASNGLYDISLFKGVQFYVKVAPDDNAPSRQFFAYTLQAYPGPGAPPAGFCQNPNDPAVTHCYDPFYYDYTDIQKGEWVFVQKRWEELKQFGNGSTPDPATFTGVNLQQFLFFGWSEGNSAQSGLFTLDYWVTGAAFF